jgi:hypothetical protein
LNEKRPFSVARVYQAKGMIFRNIRLLEARSKAGASDLRDEGMRHLSDLLTTKGSR